MLRFLLPMDWQKKLGINKASDGKKKDIVDDSARFLKLEQSVEKLTLAQEESLAIVKEVQAVVKESLADCRGKLEAMDKNEDIISLKKELET